MEKEILTALVEMVKQGGTLAIVGIGVYWLMAILKLAVHGGIVWLVFHLICKTFIRAWELRLDKRNSTITLLSEQASKDICNRFQDISSETTAILKDIEAELKVLKTKPNISEEKK